jgi:hypothetical protein
MRVEMTGCADSQCDVCYGTGAIPALVVGTGLKAPVPCLYCGATGIMSVGDRIKIALGGVSVGEFAKVHGIARPLLSRWINDPRSPPSEKSLCKIAAATGVTMAWLRYGSQRADGEGRESEVRNGVR